MEVEKILDKLSSIGYLNLGKVSGDYFTVKCPFHSNGKESKPSCGVLLRDQYKNGNRYKAGMWHCFACGTVLDMKQAVYRIYELKGQPREAANWINEYLDEFSAEKGDALIPSDLLGTVIDKYAAQSLKMRVRSNSSKSYISEEELASYRFTIPYMYERKLTDEIIARYDVGFDANHIPPGRSKPLPCVTFPVRDIKGNTLFFCRRSVQGKYFNYPEGVTKPVYGIYELPRDCKQVIICESVFNALTAAVYGYNAVALLGTGNTYQISQLKQLGVHSFILCLDNDDAGRRGAAKLKKALSDCAIVWTCTVPEGKDVNDLSKEEFEEVLSNKE